MKALFIVVVGLLCGCSALSKFHVYELPQERRDVIWIVHAEEFMRCWMESWGPVCMTAEKLTPEKLTRRRVEHERIASMAEATPGPAPAPELKPPPAQKPKPAAVAPAETSTGYDWTKK